MIDCAATWWASIYRRPTDGPTGAYVFSHRWTDAKIRLPAISFGAYEVANDGQTQEDMLSRHIFGTKIHFPAISSDAFKLAVDGQTQR